MRLLDRIVSAEPFLWLPEGAAAPLRLAGAADHAPALRDCALRYVLDDDLATLCTSLAFCAGQRLVDCLDLLRVPSTRLWVEWREGARLAALPDRASATASAKLAGVLVDAEPGGRRGVLRTLWCDDATTTLAPLETHFDLDRALPPPRPISAAFDGGTIAVAGAECPAVDALYAHVRFRFEPTWAAYYRRALRNDLERQAVVTGNVASVARDLPVVLAFWLLLGARGALSFAPVRRDTLNRARERRGRAPLLDHVEVRANLASEPVRCAGASGAARSAPRLHHVRGHFVRRRGTVFWRMPHLRGDARHGTIRSRTVRLSFSPPLADARAAPEHPCA